jgi:PA domain/Peptidase family M28
VLACFALGGRASAAAHSPRPAVKVTLDVQVKPAGSRHIVASGKVTPASTSGRVEIQFRRDGGWGQLAGGRLKDGAFSFSAAVRGDDSKAYLRAVVVEGGKQVGVSAVRSIRVERRAPAAPPTGGGAPVGVPPAGGAPTGEGPTPPAPPVDPLSASSLMATIDGYSALPNHLSGTANSAAALDEFQSELSAAGLRPGEQAFTFPRFAVGAVGLTAGTTTVPAAAIAPLLYSGTTPAGGVTAPLFDGGSTGTSIGYTATQVAGKIVVVSVPYEHNSKAENLYPAIETAVEGGAKGLIAVTQTVGDYPKWEDVNARNGTGPLPVLMVGKRSGAAVIAAAAAGEEGTLTLAAETTGLSCDRDVWGELEGADPSRRVFVGVPASSFTPSASEHGTGVAITVGLARYYASLPQAERPETLVFMALGGHEIGWLGLQALLASPQGAWFKEADAYVHLGSALGAPVATEEPDGTIVTTTTPDPTGRLHDSENPLLEHSIVEDFAAAGVPTPETPPHTASGGEQTNAYAAGIPTVSFSGASLFFHTAGDLPSAVDPTILAKQADAFRRAVDTITAIPAGVLKAENANAAKLGSEINAAARAPVNPTLGAGGKLGSGGIGGPAATPVAQCP